MKDTRQDDLYDFARRLVDAGYGIWAVGSDKRAIREADDHLTRTRDEINDEALDLIDRGKAQGVALRLGWDGRIETEDGRYLVPFMLEREAPTKATDDFRGRMSNAIFEAQATTTFGKLKKHWVEDSPSGGRHWYGMVDVTDERAWDDLRRKLPAVQSFAQTDEGVLLAAELLVVGYSVVAPSYGHTHPSGNPYTFVAASDGTLLDDAEHTPELKPGALRSLSKALAIASASDASLGQALLPVPAIARPVMHAYNDAASDQATLDMLLDAGWTIHKGDLDSRGFVELTRPDPDGTATPRSATIGREHRRFGDEDYLPGGVTVWTSGDSKLTKGYHTPFDVYVRLHHKGKVSRAVNYLFREELVDLAALKDQERRALSDSDRVFFDPEHIDLASPEHGSTSALSGYIAERLREIESPRGDVPYLLRLASGIGMRPSALLEVHSALRGTRRWDAEEAGRGFTGVLLNAVQPCEFRVTEDGVKYPHRLIHEVTPSIREAVFRSLVSDAHIPTVALQLREPTFVRVGDTNEFKVVQRSGLDLATQSHLDLDEESWTDYNVNERPSGEDAVQAFRYLTNEILGDFYFETAEDHARAVVYLLSAVARPATRIAPSFGFDAPGKGAGKSLLARAGQILAVGKTHGVSNITDPSKRANDEIDKRIGAAMLAGHRFIHVDELGRNQVDAPVLMTLTATPDGGNSSRELGRSGMIDVSGLILTVCGNNIRVGGDINRRFLNIRLQQAEVTRAMHAAKPPRYRDIAQQINQDRPRLLAAAHTILLHGVQNPAATPYEALASFETWADVVLAGLTHVRLPGDDLSVAERAFEGRQDWMDDQEDLGRTVWEPVLTLIHDRFADAPVNAGQVQELVKSERISASLPHLLKEIIHNDPRSFARAFPRAIQSILRTQIPSEDGRALLSIDTRKDRTGTNTFVVTSIDRDKIRADAPSFVEAPTEDFAAPAPVERRRANCDTSDEEVTL